MMFSGTLGVIAMSLQLAGSAAATEAAVRAARGAQERFETTRRAHLPRVRSLGTRECDIIVGRFCYWHDSTDAKPGPEPRRIVSARRQLVALLDSLATRHPDSDWLVGQLVRYTIEGGDSTAARAVARRCRATPWWCAALEGLTHHVAERYADAERSFEAALAAMSDEQRCEWMDLRRHVPYSMAGELRKASCAERSRGAERLWRISQPLWSVHGNDLRSEHFARHTMALILARSANPYGMSWSTDNRELLLRYGWAEWFTRGEPSPYQTTPGAITGHDREPSYFVFPVTPSPSAPVREDSWSFRDASMPMRYAPRHIEWMGDLSHQLVRFPRGDSLVLLVVARARDSALARDSIRWLLAALRDSTITRSVSDGSVMTLRLPSDSALVSVEAFGARTRRAERARYSVAPIRCERRCLSDLLLFRANQADTAASLATVASRGLTGVRVAGADLLGVYWEVGDGGTSSSAPRDSLVWASVTVEPERVSVVRRAAARLRLASTPTAVRLRWRFRLAPTGSVSLRLPANARGRYRIRLAVDGAGMTQRIVVID